MRTMTRPYPRTRLYSRFDRNSVSGLVALGHCKLMTGSMEDVIPLMERAIRLSPRDPQIAVMNYRIGEVHLLQSRIDQAIASLERARSDNLELAYVRAFLASAYALKGETERAATELSQARRLSDGYASIAEQTAGFFWVPKTGPCSKPPISPACAKPGCRRSEQACLTGDARRRELRDLMAPHSRPCAGGRQPQMSGKLEGSGHRQTATVLELDPAGATPLAPPAPPVRRD